MAGSPMADVAAQSPFQPSKPRPIQGGGLKIQPPTSTGPLPEPIQSLRSGHLTLDTFSPVNQNGSFEFDRVIKSGQVQKRTRKTKARIDNRPYQTKSNPLCSHGRQSTSSYARISSPSTAILKRPSCAIKSPSLILQPLRDRRTRRAEPSTYSVSFLPLETSTSKPPAKEKHRNGSN